VLPQDIILQGSIFIIAYMIIPENQSSLSLGVFYFIGYIFAFTLLVFFSRRSLKSVDSKKIILPLILTIIGYSISSYLLYYSIILITGGLN
jgi:ABC-type Fe3+-siderophore transport system permease subunit